jgi:formylglycine-generating enzyme required for sulfatase activity
MQRKRLANARTVAAVLAALAAATGCASHPPPPAPGELPACPFGYTHSGTGAPVLCKNGLDVVVRVGFGATAFWVDRFEASLIDNASNHPVADPSEASVVATFPQNGQWTGVAPRYHAESRAGVPPVAKITWFQANAACRAAGKRLPTGSEWLEAARGTVDPGASSGASGACVTQAPGPRDTGGGTQCVSAWGAQDMIGNLWEWTDEWQAGLGNASKNAAGWPPGYGDDGTWNIASSAYWGNGIVAGLPAAALRGGRWDNGTLAGVFALTLDTAPTVAGAFYGFRCIIPR